MAVFVFLQAAGHVGGEECGVICGGGAGLVGLPGGDDDVVWDGVDAFSAGVGVEDGSPPDDEFLVIFWWWWGQMEGGLRWRVGFGVGCGWGGLVRGFAHGGCIFSCTNPTTYQVMI